MLTLLGLVKGRSADRGAESNRCLIHGLIHGGHYLGGRPDCLHEQAEQP